MKHTATTGGQKKLPDKPQGTFRARLLNYFSCEEKSISIILSLALGLSYIQILFGCIHLIFYYIPIDDSLLSDMTHLLADFVDFADTFHYGHDDAILLLACCCIVLYLIFLIAGLLFTVCKASRSQQPKTLLTRITPLLIQIHALLLFFPISNIANRLQVESANNNLTRLYFELGSSVILSLSIVVYVINVLLTIVPYVWLFHILPSPNPLSSKNCYLDQLTLYQKLLVPLIARTMYGTGGAPWIVLPINLLISSLRQFWCAYAWPRHHLTTFMIDLYGASFNAIFSILLFILFVINELVDIPRKTDTIIIILLISFLLIVTIIRNRLNQHIGEILDAPVKKLGPYKSIYKLQVMKYYQDHMSQLNKNGTYVDPNYFYFSIINNFPDKIFGQSTAPNNPVDLESKDGKHEIKRNYLEYLTMLFNKHDEFKLILAKFYAKSLTMYTIAIKLIMRVKFESGSFYARASAEALHLQVQEQILTKEQAKNGKLNFVAYINELSEQESLKEEIKKQLNCYIDFWQEYSENKSNAYKLQDLAQSIHNQKIKVEKIWTHLENKPDKKYYHLCLLYSRYQLLLNNSPEKASKYLQKHTLFNKQYDIKIKLDVATLFDVNNFSVTITTQQEKMGIIKHSSANIQKALGYQPDVLIGSNVGLLMSPYVAERHNSFLHQYVKTGKAIFIGAIRSVFLRNSSGLLVKSSIFTNIHPFVDEDVYLTALFRLDKEDSLEYIFVTPEGDIDSCTAGIASKLGINRKNAHIENICRDVELIIGSGPMAKIDREKVVTLRFETQKDEKEQIYLTSAEDLLPSPKNKQLLSSRLNSPHGLLLSDRSRLLLTENEKYGEEKDMVYPKDIEEKQRIEFNFYALFPNRIAQTFSYECTITTVPVKKEYLRLIAIEMIDPKKRNRRQSDDYDMTIGKELDDSPKDQIKNLEVNPGSLNINKSSSSPEKEVHTQTQEQPNAPQLKRQIQNAQQQIIEGSLSNGTASSGNHKTASYIEEALTAKYYPRQHYSFMIVMGILVITTLALVLTLKVNNEKSWAKIKALTTIMDLANQRADAFTLLARTARGAYIIRENLLVPNSTTSINNIKYINTNFPSQISALKNYNDQLQFAIQDVADSFQESFTVDDIRIYDFTQDLTIGSYRKFDTFMAINVLLEKLLSLAKDYAALFPMNELHAIFQNLLNDLLDSTIQSVDIIYEEIQSSIQNNISMIHTFQIVCMVLTGLRFAMGLGWYYSLYNANLSLFQKFFTIFPKHVQIIRKKLEAFSQFLDEESLGMLDTLENDNAYYVQREVRMNDKNKISRLDKNLKKTGLQMQYWKRAISYFVLMSIQVVQLSILFFLIPIKVQNIVHKINSLAETESIQYELAALSFTLSQVLSNDNVTTIRNRPAEDELVADLKTLSTYTNVLMTAFTESDGTIDPIVDPFFFGDVCQLASASVLSTCVTIAQDSQALGLFALFSRHYQLISNLYQEFQLSNKTLPVLQDLVLSSFTLVIPSLNLIKDLLSTMVIELRNNILDVYQETYNGIEALTIWNIVSVIIFMIIINKFVYGYLANYFNRFKRMLEVVPFDVLLSNPTLKGILIISSKGKLNRIKNEI